MIVPKSMSDENLIAIAQFRCLGRFPVLSYYHKSKKVSSLFYRFHILTISFFCHQQTVLLRSGQPMVGSNSKRCKEDERLINTVLGAGRRGYIIETRTQNLAQLARNKGGGFELEMYYPLWKRVHKPIDRHSTLMDCLSKLVEGKRTS